MDNILILERDLYPDFIIVCGEKEFPCHKSVLASQSKVFAAMLASENKESLTNRMTMDEDFSTESERCDSFLNFLYKRKLIGLQYDLATVLDLFIVGHKYEILHLEIAMWKILIDEYDYLEREEESEECILTMPIAFRLYEFCFNVQKFQSLENLAIRFFKLNLRDFMISDEYKQLLNENMEMAKNLASKVCDRCLTFTNKPKHPSL